MPPLHRTAAGLLLALVVANGHAQDAPPPDGFTLSGKLEAPIDEPVTLTLDHHVAMGGGGYANSFGVREATLRPGESFRFEGLPPAWYSIRAGSPSHGSLDESVYVFGDVSDHVVRLQGAATIRGRVKLAFEGKLEDVGVSPVVAGRGVTRGYSRCEADGRYEFANLEPRDYFLSVSHTEGGMRFLGKPVDRYVPVTLGPGTKQLDVLVAPDENVRLTVRSANPGETFEGNLRNAADPEWKRLYVRVAKDDDGNPQLGVMTSMGHGLHWTDAGPAIEVPGLPKGRHTLRIEALGFQPWEDTIEVEGTTRIDAILQPLAGQYLVTRMSGRFFNVDYRPVAAKASRQEPWERLLWQDDRNVPSHTRTPGVFRAFLPPGEYELSASTDSHSPGPPQRFRVGGDRTERTVTVPLAGGHELAGRLVWPSGKPVGGCDVNCFRREDGHWRPLYGQDTYADPETGTFTMRGLADGSYRLTYDCDGKAVIGYFQVDGRDVSEDFELRRR